MITHEQQEMAVLRQITAQLRTAAADWHTALDRLTDQAAADRYSRYDVRNVARLLRSLRDMTEMAS